MIGIKDLQCPNCKSIDLIKKGQSESGKQKYRCAKCGRETVNPISTWDGVPVHNNLFKERVKPSFMIPGLNTIINQKINKKHTNKLYIGDTHEPFLKQGYFDFCLRIRDKFKCEEVYHMGDIVDNHAISFHTHDPDGRSSGDEFEQARKELRKWFQEFPIMKVCAGNHCLLPTRQAAEMGITRNYMKTFLEAFEAPKGWEYEFEFYDKDYDIKVIHGTGYGGNTPHITAARNNMCNVIIGHAHSIAGVDYLACPTKLVWGMSVGCGIDRQAYAFEYGRTIDKKPILSVGVLVDGIPQVVPMIL
jgi:hypothetical protein